MPSMNTLKSWVVRHKNTLLITIALLTLLVGVVASARVLRQQDSPEEQFIVEVNTIGIPLATYEARLSQQATFFSSTEQPPSQSELSKQVIDTLIKEQIISSYAESRNISVTQPEVDARFVQMSEAYSSEAELLQTLQDLYGKDKEAYTQTLALDMLRERVAASVSDELSMSLQDWLSQQLSQADITRYELE